MCVRAVAGTGASLVQLERNACDCHSPGLVNTGNSCYQSAVIMCFSMFANECIRLRAECDWKLSNGISDLDTSLCSIVSELEYRRADSLRHPMVALNASEITQHCAAEFAPGAQHCAAEFARNLISRTVLLGQFTISGTRVVGDCSMCGSETSMTRSEMMIVVAPAASMKACIDEWMAEKLRCRRCLCDTNRSQAHLIETPPSLCVHISRCDPPSAVVVVLNNNSR